MSMKGHLNYHYNSYRIFVKGWRETDYLVRKGEQDIWVRDGGKRDIYLVRDGGKRGTYLVRDGGKWDIYLVRDGGKQDIYLIRDGRKWLVCLELSS